MAVKFWVDGGCFIERVGDVGDVVKVGSVGKVMKLEGIFTGKISMENLPFCQRIAFAYPVGLQVGSQV